MNRFFLSAILVLALALTGTQSARANGFATYPGYINLSGGISLSWGSFGWSHNPPAYYGGYAYPMPYNAYPYPMYYGYGYGYPGSYGY